jgi:hypothetical protein
MSAAPSLDAEARRAPVEAQQAAQGLPVLVEPQDPWLPNAIQELDGVRAGIA